jgi:MSHA biogenesis protein MshQ
MRTHPRSLVRLLLLFIASLCGVARAAYYTADTSAYVATTYPWIDISSTGTVITMGDDAVSSAISLGFTFNYGGTNYTTVKVQSNGMLQFGSTATTYTNAQLPLTGASGEPNIDAVMLPLWDDLFQSGNQLRYRTQGTAPNRVFIVSWNAVPFYCSSGTNCSAGHQTTSLSATFQVQIYEQGQFVYRYGAIDGSGGTHSSVPTQSNPAGATIGYEVSNSDYVQFSYHTASVPNGTTILWSRDKKPLAEFLFNEASWVGTTGEVADTVGSYDGTAASLSTTKPSTSAVTPAEGTTIGTCGYGVFNRANKDYVALPSSFPNLGTSSDFTITAWIRSTDVSQPNQRILIDDEHNTSGYGFSLGEGGAGRLRFYSRGTPSNETLDTAAVITNNTWYFVAATLSLSSKTKTIYVFDTSGNLLTTASNTYTESSFGSDTGIATIGGESNAATEGNTSFGFSGNIDEVRVYQAALNATELAQVLALTSTCPLYLNHLEIRHSTGSGLTCAPSTLTIAACQDAACATPYTGGVSGTLTAGGTGMTVNWPSGSGFTIASGSSTTTDSIQVTTPGSVLLGTSGVTVTASSATTCNFGNPTCTFTAQDSGFIFDVPDHVAEVQQAVSVSAVQKSNTSNACVPAFASQTKAVTFKCSYLNPGSGTLPVRVGGGALNASNSTAAACDATGRAVSLSFNASGVASTTVQYADAGQMQLNASYTGATGSSEAGLTMTGSDTFVAVPASFTVAANLISPATKYVAGVAFGATVTAKNSAGNTTPNYGKESSTATPTLTFNRVAPTGSGTSSGTFSGNVGAFTSGVATGTNLVWTEVGIGDLTATISNYLGSSLSATGTTGTTGAVGPFIPHHFLIATTPGCTASTAFTYSGQPFTTTITAQNAASGRTYNYTGAYAKATTLTAATLAASVGTFGTTGAVAASSFTNGVATLSTPTFTFVNKLTAPKSDAVRATDTDSVSSSGFETGAGMVWRSGRLKLSNAFGSEKSSLDMPAQTQYWSGNTWVLNDADSCTAVPVSAVARSNYLSNTGASTSAWTTTPTGTSFAFAGGKGTLTLGAPSPTATGSVDIALNLGSTSTTADVSCLTSHPATTGAGVPWLQSQNGNCATTFDRDPSARATFGIYPAETKKTVHVRELF